MAGEARVVVGLVATLFILLSLFDQALLIARLFPAAGEIYTTFWVFLHALPGLIVLMLPLFAWEPLSDVTPVDEIVRWWFK